MQRDLNGRVGQATKWSSITEILAKLISPIVNMVLARLLTPEAFGLVATITMVISFAEIFTDAGFQKYIIQHEYASDDELDKSTNVAFWTNLGVSSLICVLIFFFRHQIASLVGSPGLGNSISIASVLIIIAAFSSIQMARYKRAFDFKTLFFARIGTALIPLLITVPLAIVLKNYWALLIGNFASQLFTAIVLTIKSKWKPSFYYSFPLLKEMLSFSIWTLLESISIWLTSYIGVFIVGNYLNEYYLGIYKTSMSTVNSYMAIITGALTPVLFSALSRYQHDEENYKETYYHFQRLTALFVIPMGVGIFVYSDLVTQILLGDQWTDASDFIGLWGLTSALVIVFSHFASEVYRSKGKPRLSMLMQLLHIAFLVPVMLFAIPYGFQTLAVARSLVRLQLVVCTLPVMHFVFGIQVQCTLKNIFPMIFSAIIMGVSGHFLQMIHPSLIWQIVSVFLCVLIYFFTLLLFPSARKDVFELKIFQKIKQKLML